MKTEATPLPDDTQALKSIIAERDARIEHLEERLAVLEKMIFGPKSEKRRRDESEGVQLSLFNEAEAIVAEKEIEQQVPAHTRAKPKRKPLPDDLPRVEIVHDIAEEEKVCACGAALSRIGDETSEKLDIIPAKIQVIRHIRPKYACKSCQGVEGKGPTIVIAPPPLAMIPKGIASEGLLAHIAVSKYSDALPLYRQEKMFERIGVDLSRQTMAGWMVMAAGRCAPLMDLLEGELLSGPLVNADETPIQVMNELGRENTTRSFMWVFRGGDPLKPVVFFRYHPTRSGEVPRQILSGYKGFVQTDAFSAYEGLERDLPGVKLVGCFAHVRRNFLRVVDAKGKNARPGSAETALGYVRKLYAIEKTVRASGLSPPEMLAVRKEKAGAVLEEFKAWLDKRASLSPPKGLLGNAINYALKHWPKLVRYLEDGNITPDNNLAENAIRPFVVGRKNWLFAGHPNGAQASATLYSLIETAKACGLEPWAYLRFLFEKIPHAKSECDWRQLLPQRLTPEPLTGSISDL